MAKTEHAGPDDGTRNPGNLMPGTEHAVMDVAEDLGRFLGTIEAKVQTWASERDDIRKQLLRIQATAGKLLSQLGGEGHGRRLPQ